MGDVTDFSNFMGAVIDDRAFAKHKAAIARVRRNNHLTLLAGGQTDDSVGYFVRPTVVQSTDPTDQMFTTEYFGPILAVHVYDDARYDRVVQQMESFAPYALTGAIIAQDRAAVAWTAATHLRFAAGNFYINDKPTGAVVGQQPFGGARASGTNDKAGAAVEPAALDLAALDQGDVRAAEGLPLPATWADACCFGFACGGLGFACGGLGSRAARPCAGPVLRGTGRQRRPPVVHTVGGSSTPGACALALEGHARPSAFRVAARGGWNPGRRERSARRHHGQPPTGRDGWAEGRGDLPGAKEQAPGVRNHPRSGTTGGRRGRPVPREVTAGPPPIDRDPSPPQAEIETPKSVPSGSVKPSTRQRATSRRPCSRRRRRPEQVGDEVLDLATDEGDARRGCPCRRSRRRRRRTAPAVPCRSSRRACRGW